MPENFLEYLRHILDECSYITHTLQGVKSYQDFIANEDKKRALVRSLEVIGEASKKVPGDIKYKWKEIEWKAIAGMRDKLIHDYKQEVDYEIVWDTATRKIPGTCRADQRYSSKLTFFGVLK